MGTAADVVRIAVGEKGYAEGAGNRTKYAPAVGHANGLAWCATYVAWCMKQAGVAIPSTSASTVVMATGFCKAGQWRSRSETPQPGDVVFFNFPGHGGRPSPGCGAPRGICHVGIVVKDQGSTVLCAEGNSAGSAKGDQRNGGEVVVKARPKKLIAGYGVPKYGKGGGLSLPLPKKTAPAPRKDENVLGPEDKKWLSAEIGRLIDDRVRVLLRAEDPKGKPTGHPNLRDIAKAVTETKALIEAEVKRDGDL